MNLNKPNGVMINKNNKMFLPNVASVVIKNIAANVITPENKKYAKASNNNMNDDFEPQKVISVELMVETDTSCEFELIDAKFIDM